MIANVRQVSGRVATPMSRRGFVVKLGQAALAVAAVIGGLFTITSDARAVAGSPPLDESWSGSLVLIQDGEPIDTGTIDLTIESSGQFKGTADVVDTLYEVVGSLADDGRVILIALPPSPDDHGALFRGVAINFGDGRLVMSLSSVPFHRLQIYLDLTRQ